MNPLSNLEPIEEKDLDLERKFAAPDFSQKSGEAEKRIEKKDFPLEVSPAEREIAYERILSGIKEKPQEAPPEKVVREDARILSKKNSAESQVQHLVDIALTKGVTHAVKVAKHLEENYVIDTFHNRMLADDLRNELIKKGII